MVQQFPATTAAHHNKRKTSKLSDSNCSENRVWHPRDHQWPNHPKTPNIISCLWASLVHLCSSIGVETDLWLLNLQVIKRKRVASWGTNSWLFTCWLPCRVSGDPSLIVRQTLHDSTWQTGLFLEWVLLNYFGPFDCISYPWDFPPLLPLSHKPQQPPLSILNLFCNP